MRRNRRTVAASIFLNTQAVLNAISSDQDIDVLSEAGIEACKKGTTKRIPPVAAAVWEVLQIHEVDLHNKKIVILGKGKLVGMPLMQLFEREQISYCAFDLQSKTDDMLQSIKDSDIVITGFGKPYFLKPDMVKDGVILIDCGTSESEGKLTGDIDPTCASKASLFTPVPGGIGPITVACLYRNLFLE